MAARYPVHGRSSPRSNTFDPVCSTVRTQPPQQVLKPKLEQPSKISCANESATGRRQSLLATISAPLALQQLLHAGTARAATVPCQGERGYGLQQVSAAAAYVAAAYVAAARSPGSPLCVLRPDGARAKGRCAACCACRQPHGPGTPARTSPPAPARPQCLRKARQERADAEGVPDDAEAERLRYRQYEQPGELVTLPSGEAPRCGASRSAALGRQQAW